MLATVAPTSDGTAKVVLVSALFLLQVACFVHFLGRFDYLPGTDAYYYAVQTQSLLDVGHLKVPDGGVLNYFIAALCRCGLSIAMAFKVALTAIYGLYNLGILLLVLRFKDGSRSVALLLWVFSNSVVAFHTIEFPELSFGLALVPVWFWLLLSAFKRRTVWLFLALASSALVHTAAAVLAVLFAAVMLAGKITLSPQRLKRPPLRVIFLVLLGCAAVVIAIAIKWSLKQRLASLRPGAPGLPGLAMSADIPTDLKLTLLFFWLLLLVLFFVNLSGHSGRWKYLGAAILALPLWPSHDSGLLGLGGRLAALFVFPALPLIVLMCDEVSDRWKIREQLKLRRAGSAFAGAAILMAMAILPTRLNSYDGLLVSDDYAAYEKVVSALAKSGIPLLIAHRGLDFFYSYRLRRDAFHFDPEPEWKRAEIWRVAMRITPEEVAFYSPPSCPWGETAKTIPGTDYLLVREDCWEQLRARIRQSENPDLYVEVWENGENPSQPRPAFLRARY
jgi:hypothetical protein